MGVPSRFAIEYPQRVMQLIGLLEKEAHERDMLGSFGLLAANAVLTIPLERMKAEHPLHDQQKDLDLARALEELKGATFLEAPFWRGDPPEGWRQSRIMGGVEHIAGWLNQEGQPSLSTEANAIDRCTAEGIVHVLRNALAHGNIIYLDENDREIAGNPMTSMAFLSRYEKTRKERAHATTHHVVVAPEREFLRFVKAWASWVGDFALDPAVIEAT